MSSHKGTQPYTVTVTKLLANPTTGSIGGHKIACTCGMVWVTSLSVQTAKVQSEGHLAYHENFPYHDSCRMGT